MDSSRLGTVLTVALVILIGASAGAAGTMALTAFFDVSTSGDVPLQSPDGMNATIVGDVNQNMTTNFPTSGTVEYLTDQGNITFFSAGQANLSFHADEITGTWTNASEIDADPNAITINPEDKPSFVVGNEIDNISVRDSFALDDGTVDFVYGGSTGQSRVTIQGVPGNQEIVAVDASTGTFLDTATSGGSGQVTFDALTNSKHAVLLQTTDFSDPVLSNPSPTGDLSNEPTQISVDVNDSDFSQGDSVDVTIDLDGTQIHSETITANQTVSVAIPQSGQTGGAHDWTVTATPDYGNPTANTYQYRVPSNLTIRNELDHDDIIDSPISSNITFFGDDQIVTRQTNDGTVNLTGLPVNQDFIAEVVPSDDNWTTRAIYFESIYQQQSIYLLNTSAVSTVNARFVLNDPTAQFGPETVLFVQRPINVSGTTTWQTVHADEFGVEGVTTVLEEGQRYRIKVENEQGTEQIVGPYRADVSETVQVQPGTPGIELGEFEDGWAANAVLDNRTLSYRYSDPDMQTEQVTVWIHEKGDESNRLQPNESYFDLGNFSAQAMLSENESEKTWVVNFVVDRDGDQFIKSVEVSNRSTLFNLPQPWGAIVGIGLLLMLGGVFSEINVGSGAVIVAAVGGILYYVQLLGGAATAIGIIMGLFVAVVNQLRKGSSL